ncbi:MAG: hypothetical protein ACRDO4_11390 [Nocardioides sp.]
MTITFGDLRTWRSSGVATASEQLRADIKVLEEAAEQVESDTVPESWTGLGSWAAQIQQMALVAQMQTHVEGLRTFERAVYSTEADVKTIENGVADLDTDAAGHQFEIGSDGTVTDVAAPRTFESVPAAEHYSEQRIALRDGLAERVGELLDLAYEVDSALIAARPQGSFSDEGPEYVVDPEVQRTWQDMSEDERRAVLEEIAEKRAEEAGIEDFEIRIEDLEDQDGDGTDDDPTTDSRGSWSEDDRVLRIDEGNLDDPTIIGTVAHELRHAQQHQAVDDLPFWPWEDFHGPPGVSQEEVEDWEENFDDYKTSQDDGFEAYHSQPVEEDAREEGAGYLDDLDSEELERLREEAR